MSLETIISMMGPTSIAGFALWMLKRWMKTVDKRLDKVEETMQSWAKEAGRLHTSVAVAQERQSHLTGRLDQIATSINTTHKDVNSLASSVTKLWEVLKSNDLVPKRFSDDAIGNG